MSTVAVSLQQAGYTGEPPQLTVEQYHHMTASGALSELGSVELAQGVLLDKASCNPRHASGVRRSRRAVEPLLPAGYFYDSEQAVTLPDGEPEPDGAVLRGDIDDYADRHPGPADIAMVIEVADSTLARDRGAKLQSYAAAGIAVYWIVNLVDRQVEVYADPDPFARPDPTYRRREVYAGADRIPVSVGGINLTPVAVSAVLPPAEI